MRLAFLSFSIFQLCSCATILTFPDSKTSEERFTAFPSGEAWPIKKPVSIYWHSKMIPFVDAKTDEDAAFSIGVVHAHLRLGQMEIMRRASAGRLAEAGGPILVPKIDIAIRMIDLNGSAEKSLKLLSKEERNWLEHYVRGVNFFIEKMKEEPVIFRSLNYTPEKWTIVDALRIGRLAAADINWGRYFTYLGLRAEKGWEAFWDADVRSSELSVTSFASFLADFSRFGSNSVVVSGKRSSSGNALIANDPHLGIFAPNFWVLMGYRSPSYHVLGFMVPGVPTVTVGRNPDIAWGGTYMRGVSSHLFEVDSEEKFREREEKIGRRSWFSKTVTIRETKKGPILTDHPDLRNDDLPSVALGWMGQFSSNEFGTFLSVNRARNWSDFRNAFRDYGISGLNFTYADRMGNVGMIAAIRQPILQDPSEFYQLVKSSKNSIVGFRGPLELPYIFNPTQGYVASSNNMPAKTNPPLAWVPGQSDRMKRWNMLFQNTPKVSTHDLMKWQQDVFSVESLELKAEVVKRVNFPVPQEYQTYWRTFSLWDGNYDHRTRGPVAFEILIWQMAKSYFEQKIENENFRKRMLSSSDWKRRFSNELAKMSASDFEKLLLSSLEETQDEFEDFQNWGEMHVQVVRSPLGLLPAVGGRFEYQTYPADGGATTLNKAAFQSGTSKREVTFGAQSRHVSDLSSLNENYFVLLGGNDGWLDNPSLTDQIELWRKGGYVKVPLEISEIRKAFHFRKTVLRPQ